MTNLEMNTFDEESTFKNMEIRNDFEGFDGYNDDFVQDDESPMEFMTTKKMDTAEIDEIVKSEDYMRYREYLDQLDEDEKIKAQEYVQNNFPEFGKDDERIDDEKFSMKSNKVKTREIFDELDKKPHFNRSTIKSELGDALIDSYKNAA